VKNGVLVSAVADALARDQLSHHALFYDGDDQLARVVAGVVRTPKRFGHPVLIALPGERLAVVQERLAGRPSGLTWFDPEGRHPREVVNDVLAPFVAEHVGQPVQIVLQLLWPGRTPDDQTAVVEEEALLNLVFAHRPVTMLCPYDVSSLGEAERVNARRTHHHVLSPGSRRETMEWDGVTEFLVGLPPLPPVPRHAEGMVVADASDVMKARNLVGDLATQAGLPGDRIHDLQLAVSEATGNIIRHGRDPGLLQVWGESGVVTCQVHDEGELTTPLRRREDPNGHEGGYGYVLMNGLCDLVQVRTELQGTTVRLRVGG
jgi:anti-sigma regulatory factor (Ser/Thr protein kinase)